MVINKNSAAKHAFAFNLSFLIYVVMLLALVPTITTIVTDKTGQDFFITGLHWLRLVSSFSLGALAVPPLYFAFRNNLPKSSYILVAVVGLAALYIALNQFDLGAFSVPLLRVYFAAPDSCLFLLGYCGCTVAAMKRAGATERNA